MYFALALVLPIFAIAPLFYPGYIQTHSGFILLWNVADLRDNLGNLTWIPHVAVKFDSLRSDGLLPYYLASLLPFAPSTAVKIIFGLAWLLGSAGMFLGLRRWLGAPGALVSAMVYTYLPCQIATVYVRGAWGESLFWGLLPWGIWVIGHGVQYPMGYKSEALLPPYSKVSLRYTFTYSTRDSIIKEPIFLMRFIIWGLLGLSHLGLTLWAVVFVGVPTLLLTQKQKNSFSQRQIFYSLLPMLFGVLGATFINLSLQPEPTPMSIRFTDHLLYPFQLFSAYWGFGISRVGWQDGLSLQIGLAAFGLTVLSVTLWQRAETTSPYLSRTDHRLIFFLSTSVFFTILQLTAATFLWELPFISPFLTRTLTYPWQLMGFVGFCLAVLAGVALWLAEELTDLPVVAAIITLIILSSYHYLNPQFIRADEIILKPSAELGTHQLLLLTARFEVSTHGNSAEFEQGQIFIPLSAYGQLHGNDLLRLKVIWQSLQPLDQNWKVFIHLVDSNDQVVTQFDGYPQPVTHEWTPGELINDAYPLQLPPAVPPGPYRLFIGLYDESTFARLPVATDSNGRVIFNVE